MKKVVCNESRCKWHGEANEMLSAPSPFESGEMIYACPKCKEIGSVVTACDEPDCWSEATCGTPTDNGYRQTCYKHMPK